MKKKKMGKNLFKKRLRITKKGKIIRRSSNIGHTQAKESGKQKRRKKNPLLLVKNKKAILRYC